MKLEEGVPAIELCEIHQIIRHACSVICNPNPSMAGVAKCKSRIKGGLWRGADGEGRWCRGSCADVEHVIGSREWKQIPAAMSRQARQQALIPRSCGSLFLFEVVAVPAAISPPLVGGHAAVQDGGHSSTESGVADALHRRITSCASRGLVIAHAAQPKRPVM